MNSTRGGWTSSCGRLHDIVHDTPEAVEGDNDSGYGAIASFMRRSMDAQPLPQ
jgi:hypothetical protein